MLDVLLAWALHSVTQVTENETTTTEPSKSNRSSIVRHSHFQSPRIHKPVVKLESRVPGFPVNGRNWMLQAAKVSVSFAELLHILRSSCLKFQARHSVPLFFRKEPLPVQDQGQARINSVKKEKKINWGALLRNVFTQLAGDWVDFQNSHCLHI